MWGVQRKKKGWTMERTAWMNSMVSSILNRQLFAETVAILKVHLGTLKEKALELWPICTHWPLGTACWASVSLVSGSGSSHGQITFPSCFPDPPSCLAPLYSSPIPCIRHLEGSRFFPENGSVDIFLPELDQGWLVPGQPDPFCCDLIPTAYASYRS